jgi:hypothetical protein
MELLLNLLWLGLALVALGACWRASRFSERTTRSHAFVLAVCLSALIFPVVSASDDLQALGAEIEEGNSDCLCVKKCIASHLQTWGKDVPAFAETVFPGLVSPQRDPQEQVLPYSCVFARRVLVAIKGIRAPPYLESFALGASMATQLFSVWTQGCNSCEEVTPAEFAAQSPANDRGAT